jgi:hypothetical protein
MGRTAHAILPRLVTEVNVAHKLHHPGHAHTHPDPKSPTRRNFLSSLISAAVLAPWAFGQDQARTPAELAERARQMAEDHEVKGLAEPFLGITTNGKVVPGLFEIDRAQFQQSPSATPRNDLSPR